MSIRNDRGGLDDVDVPVVHAAVDLDVADVPLGGAGRVLAGHVHQAEDRPGGVPLLARGRPGPGPESTGSAPSRRAASTGRGPWTMIRSLTQAWSSVRGGGQRQRTARSRPGGRRRPRRAPAPALGDLGAARGGPLLLAAGRLRRTGGTTARGSIDPYASRASPTIPWSLAICARCFLLQSLSESTVMRGHSVSIRGACAGRAIGQGTRESSLSGPIRKTPCLPDERSRPETQQTRSSGRERPRTNKNGRRPSMGRDRFGSSRRFVQAFAMASQVPSIQGPSGVRRVTSSDARR